MTRQPAAENRFTVAWPMPRLAPVRRSVRRGWLLVIIVMSSRIQSRLGPRRVQTWTRERDAVVKPERPLLPELDLLRNDAVAHPIGRPRHRADGEFRGE